MIVANDGGVDITDQRRRDLVRAAAADRQFYHVSADNRVAVPRRRRDAGPRHRAGAERQPAAAASHLTDWHDVGGGEAGHVVSDPADPNIVYAGEYLGIITRYDHRTGESRNVSAWPENPSGHGGEDMKYRFQWTAPIAVSPHDPKVDLPRRAGALPHARRRPDLGRRSAPT